MLKNINSQVQIAQQTPIGINSKKTIATHIIVKLLKTKDKEKILTTSEEKECIKRNNYSNYSPVLRNNKARKQLRSTLNCLKEKKKNPVNPEFYSQKKYFQKMKGK